MVKFVSIGLIAIFFCNFNATAQDQKIHPVVIDGTFHIGYVNKGAYINLSGPSLSATYKNSKWNLGLVPSLRIKNDQSTPKSSTILPSLGLGLTYGYKFWSFQLPIFYNPKSNTENGSWHLGFGIGYRVSGFNKKSESTIK